MESATTEMLGMVLRHAKKTGETTRSPAFLHAISVFTFIF